MLLRVDWPQVPALLTSDSSLAALSLSLRTATASTVLCLVLGVPLAVFLATSPHGEADRAMTQYAASGYRNLRWVMDACLVF